MPDERASGDPLADLFRKFWSPLGAPLPGMAMPTLDPQEIARRIAELRAVEGWLAMNLTTVRLFIQGLEVQESTLRAMRAAGNERRDPSRE